MRNIMLKILCIRVTVLFCFMILVSCTTNKLDEINIIPKPLIINPGTGNFKLSSKTRIHYSPGSKTKTVTVYLADKLKQFAGFDLEIIAGLNNQKQLDEIILELVEITTSTSKEEYSLIISDHQIRVNASDVAGLFYGVQSLLQLVQIQAEKESRTGKETVVIPSVEIEDKPAFRWRGLMLDCSRTFLSKEYLLRYIDLLAFYKMNVLHLHLTDDQGWRLEIKKYPELTEICSRFSPNYPDEKGGFYTQDEMKEIIEYAQKRNITIVPEIEMPGHSTEIFAAFHELSCEGKKTEIYPFFSGPGVTKDILCAGNDHTFNFLENVLAEVIELFPSEYIHIGGDEAPKERWQNCPKCQARIKKEGLKNEHELQSYFIKRIEKFINSKGRKLIGWDEIAEGGLPPNATVMYWRGGKKDVVPKAVQDGHHVVMSPTTHCYFDYDVRTTPLEQTYSFYPVPEELLPEQAKYILGGQANMWTHIARTDSAIDSQIFPRLIALSEALWTKKEQKDFDDFHERLGAHYPILEKKGVNFGFESIPVKIDSEVDPGTGNVKINIHSGVRNSEIHYTTNGSDPLLTSELYNKPLSPDESIVIRAQAYKSGRPVGAETKLWFMRHLALGKEINLKTLPMKKYYAGGIYGLVDGIKGSQEFIAENWQGFEGEDFEAIINLGELKSINKISVSFLKRIRSWIFPPSEIEFSISKNGLSYSLIKSFVNEIPSNFVQDEILEFSTDIDDQEVTFIKISAKSIQICPEWHPAAGGKAWLFVDEIIIK